MEFELLRESVEKLEYEDDHNFNWSENALEYLFVATNHASYKVS